MFNQVRLPFSRLLGNHSQLLEKQQNTILSAAAIITVFNVISAASGFIKQRAFITQFYDTEYANSAALDALFVGTQIPELIFQLIIFGAVSAAFIPVFIQYRKKSEAEAFALTKTVMSFFLLTFLILSVPVFIFAREITLLRTGQAFTAEQVEIVVNLTRITLLSNFLFAISSFYGALLQSYQRFIIPALAPVLYNLGILLCVWLLAPRLGIYAAGVGMVVGAFAHMVVQIPLARKVGYYFRPHFDWRLPGLRQIFKLMPARVMSISVGGLRTLSLGFFATSIGNPSMLIMQLALGIMAAPIRFFGVPISQAALPFFSEEVAKQDESKLQELVVQSLNQISFLILPASTLILILRIPIVRLLFGASNFPWPVTLSTGRVVALIALSIAAQALVQLLIRTLYALKDTRTPFFIAVLDIALYLGICAVTTFVLGWGVLGLALATTVTAIFEFVLYLWVVHRRLCCFDTRTFFLPQLKMLAATFLMAVFLYLPFRILDELVFETSRTVELIALTITTATIGLGGYIYFAALFEVKELNLLAKLFTTFAPWQKQLAQSPEVVLEPSSDTTDNV